MAGSDLNAAGNLEVGDLIYTEGWRMFVKIISLYLSLHEFRLGFGRRCHPPIQLEMAIYY
jgi:hypothetical protein